MTLRLSIVLALGLLAGACASPARDSDEPLATMSVAEAEAQIADRGADCRDQMTTLDMVVCGGLDLALERERMDRYLQLAQGRLPVGDETLRESQAAWVNYARAECAAVSRQFEGGSVQPIMSADCLVELMRARTHTIWANHLQHMDGTPPLADEPVLTVAAERRRAD